MDQVVVDNCGRAQALHSVPALCDCLVAPIESCVEDLKCFRGALREQIADRLKAEHQSLKTLQECVMQLASDAGAFADALFQAQFEVSGNLTQAVRVSGKRDENKQGSTS